MASISVVGLGKLGAPLAAVLADAGHSVIGVDFNDKTVELLNAGKTPVFEGGLQELITKNHARLSATGTYADAILATDITFVVVPTPSEPNGSFSNRYVEEAVLHIGQALRQKEVWHLIVIVSTVMPGATDGPILAALKRALGESKRGVGLAYSPEFIALGSVIRDLQNPDLVLIGESEPHAGEVLENVLRTITVNDPQVIRMSVLNAELTKLAINTYVTMKLSYANCLAEICEAIPGADARVVTKAVGEDGRIGGKYLQPATAYGGTCFPRDTEAFFRLGLSVGVIAHLAEVTGRINDRQISRLAQGIHTANGNHNQLAAPRPIGILGVTYKPHTSITEKSAAVGLIEYLLLLHDEIVIFDPAVDAEAGTFTSSKVKWASSAEELLEQVDVLAIMTPWPEFQNIPFSAFAHKAVWDCWDVLPENIEAVEIHKIGKAQ